MDAQPLIVIRDGPVGRRSMLEGTRLDVAQVIATVRAEEGSVERAAAYLALSVSQVRGCVRYYANNQEDVDAYAERIEWENERLRAAWEREQELPAQ